MARALTIARACEKFRIETIIFAAVIVAHFSMAASRFQLDDFVPTIEDDEDDVPNFDEEQEPAPAPSAGRKRKRDSEVEVEAAPKKSKKSKKNKKTQDIEEEERQPADNDAERGVDDGTMNPDFEFAVSKDQGGIEEGFGAWDMSMKGANFDGPPKALGIDEIIERRRQKAKTATIEEEPEVNDDGDDVDGLEDDNDDELLADDAFGMGVVDAEEDEDNEDDDNAEEEDADELDGHQVNADPKLKMPTESDEENDDDDDNDMAAPVPHPDDAMTDDEAADDKAKEDPELTARKAAFFAPEDGASENLPLSTTSTSFQSLNLSRPVLRGLAAVGFNSATPIQVKAIPVALRGADLVGGAVTGSGKTAAFIIPILERLMYRPKKVPTTRVAILMPTRELAVQCFNVATKLAQFTDITFALIVGGLSLREQEATLRKRPDVVIATPGRFIDHMRNGAALTVESLEILILDEADRMLEDGFADELNEIITTIPKSRQTMLFSATMTDDLDKLIRVGMNRPARLMVNAKRETVKGLVQEFIKMKGTSDDIEEDRRLAYLLHLCTNVYTEKTIIFLPRKALAHRVKVLFALHGLKAAELHGTLSQEQRLAAITQFREGECLHLLATDLASRGLDIPHVETVINFTVPTQTETYLHRVGRTARAGRSGVACTLFSAAKGKSSGKGKQVAERTLLKPILRVARGQSAVIRTRNLPADTINELTDRVKTDQEEIEEILKEEKEERLIQQTERDITKGENLVKYEDEIASRPRRTWFQSEKDKEVASQKGRSERLGVSGSEATGGKKERKKLSGKEKKQLEAKDIRTGGQSQGWKKGQEERRGGGVLTQKHGKPKESSGGKPGGKDSRSKTSAKPKPKGIPEGHGKTHGKTKGKR